MKNKFDRIILLMEIVSLVDNVHASRIWNGVGPKLSILIQKFGTQIFLNISEIFPQKSTDPTSDVSIEKKYYF